MTYEQTDNQTKPSRYALAYLLLSLDYYRMNGRTPDTIAALKRALEKYEQAAE